MIFSLSVSPEAMQNHFLYMLLVVSGLLLM